MAEWEGDLCYPIVCAASLVACSLHHQSMEWSTQSWDSISLATAIRGKLPIAAVVYRLCSSLLSNTRALKISVSAEQFECMAELLSVDGSQAAIPSSEQCVVWRIFVPLTVIASVISSHVRSIFWMFRLGDDFLWRGSCTPTL